MKLSDFRHIHSISCAAMARDLGISGQNPARTLDRIERGERSAPADLAERIEVATSGAVSAADLHQARLDWLKLNRPERFEINTGTPKVWSAA